MRVRITNLKAINQVLGFLNKDLLQIKPIRRIIIILLMIYKQRMNRTSDYHGYLIVEYGMSMERLLLHLGELSVNFRKRISVAHIQADDVWIKGFGF